MAKRPRKDRPAFVSPELPSVAQLKKDIQRIRQLAEEAENSKLRPLHRLICVEEAMINRLNNEVEAEFITGAPSIYAVRANGDIVLWPRRGKGDPVNLYVE